MHTSHKVLAVHNGALCTVQIKLTTEQDITGGEVGFSDVTYHCPRCGDNEFVPWSHGWILCGGTCGFMVDKGSLERSIQEHILFALDPKKLFSA